jgi:TolB-like protein/tRNA A-37 threonylcarbamoyl transferase component Bud32
MTSDLRTHLKNALGSRYVIERELGGGGMSRVFVARETALGRDVVIKVIAPELREELSAERFAREVQLAARLQQANIVPVLSAGDAGGMAYFTMPFVDGQSLRTRMERGTLPLGEALDVLRDVARALAYAHAQGIVHRDIKPENVLLSSGTAVVTDFGIAKALSASRTRGDDLGARATALTQAGTSLGTPAYMAPEQALGEAVDARTDLYAWGVIAYELLAGAHPFAAHKTAQRLVAAHLTEMPTSLDVARPDLPADIAALVMQCLAKDPVERPADAGVLLSRLSAAVTPGARTAAGGRGGGRLRARWSVAALIVLAVGVAAVVAIARGVHATPTRTVVVVPFDNLGDPGDAYFAEGVSDEIAGQLARLPGLQVIGRDGVRRFRGSSRSPRDIAHELGAAYVLSGTVRWARGAAKAGVDGDTRVRIVPALVNVATGRQEWGEPSDERLTDVFKVQADVAERVASALSVTLGGAARATLHQQESRDPEARDAQLLGRYLLRQRGAANLRTAMAAFERAVARDSNYARAWAGLSEASALLPAYFDTTEADSVVLARADRAAHRAVALDSTLPEAQLALARSYSAQFRFNDALRAVDRALALDPNATLAYSLKYEVVTALGQIAAGDTATRRAVELDGLSALALNNRGNWYLFAGKMDSAIHYSERAVQVAPGEVVWKRTLGTIYAFAGRFEDATRECAAGVGPTNTCRATYGLLMGIPGLREAGLAMMGARSALPRAIGSPAWAAMVYAKAGMPDSMFSRLAVAIERRDDAFTHLITSPAFTPYQADPRWDALVGELRRR